MANCKICLNKNKACHICGISYYWMMYLKPNNYKERSKLYVRRQ